MTRKITIAPILMSMWDEAWPEEALPFNIGLGVQIANVSGMVQGADFSLWSRDYLSKEDVKQIKDWRYALTHTYEAEKYPQSEPEVHSEKLIHSIFLGLRILRPTRQRYHYLQAHLNEDNAVEPFRFSRPAGNLISVPDAETFNGIRPLDAAALATIAPDLTTLLSDTKHPVTRAIESLEVGYLQDFFHVRFLLWVSALDGLFTGRERENNGTYVATQRIKHFLGPNLSIYDSRNLPSFHPWPTTTLSNVIADIYKLRHYFAHGDWPEDEWAAKPSRHSLSKDTPYADVLCEATSVILRYAILKIIKDHLLDVFGNKAKMNAYFASKGFVRPKRKLMN